jgi:hypothetical protein
MNSGQPYSIFASGDVANVGGGSQRGEQIGLNTGFTQSINEYFNTAAFTNPALYTFGNLGRNNLTGPAFKNLDFSTYKNFALTERLNLQFRAEFFNILNHPSFGLPDSTVTDGNFGIISSTASSPRNIQFALKLMF